MSHQAIHESRISQISMIDHGIVRVQMKNKIELQPEDLDENMDIYKKILGEKASGLFLLVFAPEGSSSKESREKFADPERAKIKKAEALVILNVSQRIESNFYKNFFDPRHPVRVFEDEQEAIKWLSTFESQAIKGQYETSIAYISQIDKGVLKVEVKKNAEINEQGLKENLAIYQETIPQGGYILSIFNEFNTASTDAKQAFESPNRTALKKGEAFVVSGLSNRIELEYYIKKTKQLYPSEVFEDEKSALAWIHQLKKADVS